MSLLEQLALQHDLPHMCMNPDCDLVIDTGEDCCSQRCDEAWQRWTAEMDAHETELWELP